MLILAGSGKSIVQELLRWSIAVGGSAIEGDRKNLELKGGVEVSRTNAGQYLLFFALTDLWVKYRSVEMTDLVASGPVES